jgi:hypothetical protein
VIFSAITLVAASSIIFKLKASQTLSHRKRHIPDHLRIERLTGKKWANRHCALPGSGAKKGANKPTECTHSDQAVKGMIMANAIDSRGALTVFFPQSLNRGHRLLNER